MMRSKVNSILSLMVLVFFIPATLGFALIDHHCSDCHSHDKETAFFVTVHNHEEATCFCTESSIPDQSHDCDQHADDCHGEDRPEQHNHDCVVELKKLEEPFTPVSFDNWLPAPLEIIFTTLFLVQDQIPPESFSANTSFHTIASLKILSGYERLVMNEVFRL